MDVVWLHLMAFLGAYGLMIVFNFDVLARPHDEISSRVPDPEGMYLWKSLHESSIGRMAVVVNEEYRTDLFEVWLKINGVKAAMYDVLDTTDPVLKSEKIQILLAAAGGHSMYLDTDPPTVEHMMRAGIPSLLVCQPYVVRQEWSNAKQMRGWGDLVQEIDRQAVLKSEKTWREH